MTFPPQPAPRGLGWRTQSGVTDGAGGGNGVNPFLPGTGWDVLFTPQVLNVTETEFEVYHIYIDGPVGSAVAVLVDGHFWDFVSQGWQNGWDPSQPLLVKNGQTVQLCWSVAFFAGAVTATGLATTQPTATLWLRRPKQDPGYQDA